MSYQTSPRKRGNSLSNSCWYRNFQPIRYKWLKSQYLVRNRIRFDKSNDYTSFNELESPLFGHLNVECVKSTTAITRFIQFWIIFLVAGHLHSQILIIIIRDPDSGLGCEIVLEWIDTNSTYLKINRVLKASSNKQHQINQLLINKYISVFKTRSLKLRQVLLVWIELEIQKSTCRKNE